MLSLSSCDCHLLERARVISWKELPDLSVFSVSLLFPLLSMLLIV